MIEQPALTVTDRLDDKLDSLHCSIMKTQWPVGLHNSEFHEDLDRNRGLGSSWLRGVTHEYNIILKRSGKRRTAKLQKSWPPKHSSLSGTGLRNMKPTHVKTICHAIMCDLKRGACLDDEE